MPRKEPPKTTRTPGIGELVKRERLRAKMTQSDLEEASGVDKVSISRTENGQHEPTIRNLMRLAKGLGIEVWRLLP